MSAGGASLGGFLSVSLDSHQTDVLAGEACVPTGRLVLASKDQAIDYDLRFSATGEPPGERRHHQRDRG